MNKIKFRPYYLFYLLTSLLLIIGLFNNNQVESGWHTTINPNYWPYIIPASLYLLLTALIYRYFYQIGKPVKKSIVITHFITSLFGIILTRNLYVYFYLIGQPDFAAMAFESGSLLVIIAGPLFLIVALIVFLVGLIKANRTKIL